MFELSRFDRNLVLGYQKKRAQTKLILWPFILTKVSLCILVCFYPNCIKNKLKPNQNLNQTKSMLLSKQTKYIIHIQTKPDAFFFIQIKPNQINVYPSQPKSTNLSKPNFIHAFKQPYQTNK